MSNWELVEYGVKIIKLGQAQNYSKSSEEVAEDLLEISHELSVKAAQLTGQE